MIGGLGAYPEPLISKQLGESLCGTKGMLQDKVFGPCMELKAIINPGPQGDRAAAPVHVIQDIIEQGSSQGDTGDTSCKDAKPGGFHPWTDILAFFECPRSHVDLDCKSKEPWAKTSVKCQRYK